MKTLNVSVLLAVIVVISIAFIPAPAAAANVSRDDALAAIAAAESRINEMADRGFPTGYVNDTLYAARQALERADFAELLRTNATGELAEKTRKALEGINYQGFGYADVITQTDMIAGRADRAFLIYDSIKAAELKMAEYDFQGINTSQASGLLNQATDFFSKDMYDEAESSVNSANLNMEDEKARATTLNLLISSSKGFVEKNWIEISAIAAVVVAVAWFVRRKLGYRSMKKRLGRMKKEQPILIGLIKKAQAQRYREGTLSEFVYRVKLESCQRRLDHLRRTIPALEKALNEKKKTKKAKRAKK